MMPFDHDHRIPGRGMWKVFYWWTVTPFVVWIYLRTCYHLKVYGADRIPDDGPAIYISNHQSFLDPMALGLLVYKRPFFPMVRSSLFDSRLGHWFMSGMESIAVDRSKGEMGPMKEALKRLKKGQRLIIFPEGTRARDGALKPFKRGMMLLIKKAKVPVIPLAIEGAFDAWSPSMKYPRYRGRVMCIAGDAIDYEDLIKDGPDEAIERIKREVELLRMEIRGKIRKESKGRLPASGPGDVPYWERDDSTCDEEMDED